MPTFAEIPIDKIKPHPKNIRRHVEADAEMVASIKAHRIVTAITVVQDGAHYFLIGGHRRLDGARKADLDVVPAMIRDDLVTEADHIEAMAIENVHREDLTAIEEADAYEQLALIGYDTAKIAQVTGRAAATVTGRLKLAHLNNKAKEAIHGHAMTIEDGIKLASLEEHPAILKKVEKAIGTNNFGWELNSAVRAVEREKEHAKLRAAFEKQGLPKVTEPKGGWDYTNGPRPLWRDEDEADAWAEDKNYGPVRIITKLKGAKSDAAIAREQKRRDREEQKRKDAIKAAEIARRLRLEHVATLTAGLKIPKPLLPHLQLAVARMVADMTANEISDLISVVDLPLTRAKNDYHNDQLAQQILKLTTPQLLTVLGAALASQATGHLYVGWGNAAPLQLENAATYWAAFAESGYALPDVDVAEQADITKKLAAAQTGEKAGAA